MKLDEQASWQLPREHWSLGGTQSKIALACFDGQWFRCEGDAATTHIVKPGIGRLQHEALNECICQNIAIASGVLAAKAGFTVFDGVPALVSERFDRVIMEPKRVRRLHQEDFCQALSINPENKYTSEGGPNPSSILNLLDKQDVRLAPLYDCASAFAYDGDEVDYRSAMAIGENRNFFQLEKPNIIKYAEQAHLSDET